MKTTKSLQDQLNNELSLVDAHEKKAIEHLNRADYLRCLIHVGEINQRLENMCFTRSDKDYSSILNLVKQLQEGLSKKVQ